MRVLWIEDHLLASAAFELLLRVKMPEVSLDMASDVQSARHLAGTFRYSLVLLDWALGSESGEQTLRSLRAAGCEAPVIVVSGVVHHAAAEEDARWGIVEHIAKTERPEKLLDAVRSVLRLRLPVQRDGEAAAEGASHWGEVKRAFPELTSRQAEVFCYLMRGCSDKAIARAMQLSDTTVKTHVQVILQVVGVHRRGEAVYQARLRGVSGHER